MDGYAIHGADGVNKRVYQQYYSDAVLSYLSDRPGDALTVLDIGASDGEALDRFTQDLQTALGADIQSIALEYDRDRLQDGYRDGAAHRVQGIGQQLPVDDNTVDVTVTNLLLSFLPREDQTIILQEIDRVLRPDGVVAAEINESGRPGGVAGGRYVMSREEFSSLGDASDGFTDYPLPMDTVDNLRYDDPWDDDTDNGGIFAKLGL